MPITQNQKNIVNPFAETLQDGSRRDGVDYDYNLERNRFVIDCIHELFFSYYEFPQSGFILFPEATVRDRSESIVGSDSEITGRDLLAYTALYRQNGQVSIQNGTAKIEYLSDDEMNNQLGILATQAGLENPSRSYFTNTSVLSYNNEEGTPAIRRDISELVFIMPFHSPPYLGLIRKALGRDTAEDAIEVEDSFQNQNLPPELTTLVSSDTNVDLDDWRNNCIPSEDHDKVYYNTRDRHFYFTKRTTHASMSYYDLVSPTGEEAREVIRQNCEAAIIEGVHNILKLSGKWSTTNQDAILNASPRRISFMPYKDPRPGSRWIFRVTVHSSVINKLPEVDTFSYEDDTYTPLQKAKILLDPEKTNIQQRKTFIVGSILTYLVSTQELLSSYAEDMSNEGVFTLKINPKVNAALTDVGRPANLGTSRVNVGNEIAKITTFGNVLSLFYIYNKLVLDEDDIIELCFDEQFNLLHINSNGELLVRGSGNRNYVPNPDNDEFQSILNAFSFLTPTTFNYIFNSKIIHEENEIIDANRREEWTQFLPKYTYPEIIIDPIEIKKSQENSKAKSMRKSRLFETLSQAYAASKRDPEEFKLIYDKETQGKNLRLKVNQIVGMVDCNTAQAQAVHHVLGFWNAANEKNNVKALIRETISFTRDEILTAAVTQRALASAQADTISLGRDSDGNERQLSTSQALSSALSAADNLAARLDTDPDKRDANGDRIEVSPGVYAKASGGSWSSQIGAIAANQENQSMLYRETSRIIDEQISCVIDIVGDVLQARFLDPMGLPPAAADLIKRQADDHITVKLEKGPMISFKTKRSAVYKKMVTKMLSNLLKSLIVGIVKDLVSAVFGCAEGVDTVENDLANSLRRYDFGYVDLTESLESVDITIVAENLGIATYETFQEDDEERIRVIRATSEQLLSFISDVSIMSTPVELQQLLFGEAPDLLYSLIEETINGGQIKVKIKEHLDSEGNDQTEYYYIRPEVYRSLKWNKDNIREFFIALGDILQGAEAIPSGPEFRSPLEAYCDNRNPNVSPLRLSLGYEQLQMQYIDVIDSRITKINNLCDFLKSLVSVERAVSEFFAEMPLMDLYREMLALIASASNAAAKFIGDWIDGLFLKDATTAIAEGNNIYSTQLGVSLYYQIYPALTGYAWPTLMLRPAGSSSPWEEFDSSFWVIGGSAHPAYPGSTLTGQKTYGVDNESGLTSPPTEHPFEMSVLNISILGDNDTPYALPFQGTSGYIAGSSAAYGQYGARTGPLSFLSLYPGFFNNNPISDLTTTTARKTAYEDFGEKVIEKIGKVRDSEPFIGFTSPVFLSPRQKDTPNLAYEIFGINPSTREYERLSTWTPTENDIEGTGSQSFRYTDISEIEDADGNISFRGLRIPSRATSTIRLFTNAYLRGRIDYGTVAEGGEVITLDDGGSYQGSGTRFEESSSPMVSVFNYTERVEESIQNSVTSAAGRRRLPQYVSSINREVLKILDDKCVSQDDQNKALSIITAIQSRMQVFFVNTMPLARVYLNWNSLATSNLIINYLTPQLIKDLEEKNLLGLIYQNLEIIQKVYADEPENNFQFDTSALPEENFKVLIKAVYEGMLTNISIYSEYTEINKSPYIPYSLSEVEFSGKSENITYIRYVETLRTFFKTMYENLRGRKTGEGSYREGTRGLGFNPDYRESAADMIQFLTLTPKYEEGVDLENLDNIDRDTDIRDFDPNFDSDYNIFLLGNHYLPIGALYASYLIYYDYSIRHGERYTDTNYKMLLEIAGSDDGLISALRGVFTRKYTAPYAGFPVTVDSYTQDYSSTYYNTVEAARRIEYLNTVLETTALSFEAIYGDTSLRDIYDMDLEDFTAYYEPIYRNYSGVSHPFQGIDILVGNPDLPTNINDQAPILFYTRVRELIRTAIHNIPTDLWDVYPNRYTPEFYFTTLTSFLRRTAEQLPNTGTSLAGLRLRDNPAPTNNLDDWIFWNMNLQAAPFLICGLSGLGNRTIINDEGQPIIADDRYSGGICPDYIGFYVDALPSVQSLQLIRNEKNILEKLIINNE